MGVVTVQVVKDLGTKLMSTQSQVAQQTFIHGPIGVICGHFEIVAGFLFDFGQ